MAIGAGAIKAGAEFDKAFRDIQKVLASSGTSAGTTEQEFASLREEFRKIALEKPVDPDIIMKIGAIAAQAGIGAKELPNFTRTIIDLDAAVVDLDPEQATNQMALFLREMGQGTDVAANAASTITTLGNSFPGATKDVLAMAQIMGGFAKSVGISTDEVLGMSNALVSLGAKPELGGRAMGRLMIKIAEATAQGGDLLKEFAKVAGVSAKEFADKWKANPTEAITEFIGGLQRIEAEGGDILTLFPDLEINEIRLKDAVLRQVSAQDTLTSSLSMSKEAWKTNDAHIRAAKISYESIPALMQSLKNHFRDVGIELF